VLLSRSRPGKATRGERLVEATVALGLLAFLFLELGAATAGALRGKREARAEGFVVPAHLQALPSLQPAANAAMAAGSAFPQTQTANQPRRASPAETAPAASEDSDLARHAAALALEEGEALVRGPAASRLVFSHACTDGLCLPSRTDTPVWAEPDLDVWSADATSRTYSAGVPGVAKPARYIVELMGDEDSGSGHIATYRITAAAWGAKPSTYVGLQTIVRVAN
jgi:Tfp pilus assembly protein PilX